jgi:peptidoglycan/xylan/chitin deacetylase (PgdA/CDA1 family)
MRPPFGNANKKVTALLNSMGYTVVNWSVDSKDYVTHDLDDAMENYHNDLRAGSSLKGAIAQGHDVCIHDILHAHSLLFVN